MLIFDFIAKEKRKIKVIKKEYNAKSKVLNNIHNLFYHNNIS